MDRHGEHDLRVLIEDQENLCEHVAGDALHDVFDEDQLRQPVRFPLVVEPLAHGFEDMALRAPLRQLRLDEGAGVVDEAAFGYADPQETADVLVGDATGLEDPALVERRLDGRPLDLGPISDDVRVVCAPVDLDQLGTLPIDLLDARPDTALLPRLEHRHLVGLRARVHQPVEDLRQVDAVGSRPLQDSSGATSETEPEDRDLASRPVQVFRHVA